MRVFSRIGKIGLVVAGLGLTGVGSTVAYGKLQEGRAIQEKAHLVETLQRLEARRHYVCDSRFGEVATGAAAIAKKGCEEGYKTAISNAKSAFHAWW